MAKWLWKLARFLYRLDAWMWHPSGTANKIVSWMEVRGICCERHRKVQNG